MFMKKKLEFTKKHLLGELSKISNNVVVNNFVLELINHGSITNFFCNDNHYFFKSGENDYISIYLNSNGVIVNSLIDGIDQVFQYDKSENNSKIISNIVTNINWPNHSTKRTVLLFVLFDKNEKLVSYELSADASSKSDDEEINLLLKNNIYDHYKITSLVNVVGDKLVKVETIDYVYDYTKNSIRYGVSPFNGFDTLSSFASPQFTSINEFDYNFVKNGAQKVKTMV